jgi:hypothetical protein
MSIGTCDIQPGGVFFWARKEPVVLLLLRFLFADPGEYEMQDLVAQNL